ncbi:MAG: glycosyltransferase family 1 protein, partial [Bacteroides sp.]
MKIGFDAKRAVQNRTGLGNYSRFVIEILTTYADRNKYVL